MRTAARQFFRPDRRDLHVGVGLALLLVVVSLASGPGLVLGRAVLINGVAVIVGLGMVLYTRLRPAPTPGVWGQWSVALFAGFVALSAFSITWSVEPSATWDEVNRLLGYLAAFAAAVVAARNFPARWRAVLFGLALASVVMSLVAIASKVSPELLSPREINARLREPLEYWNAVGLVAAFGVPLWLYYGTRRTGRPVLDILAAPALTILFVTLMLTYSRGALIAAIVATGFWLLVTPLRLRTCALLVGPLVGAAVIVLWAFGQADLTTDDVDLLARETAGHRLGVVLLATLALVTLVSLVTQFLAASRPPGESWRRRVGIVLLGAALLVPVAGVVALSQSSKGLSGTVSNGWTQLTNPDAVAEKGSVPDNSPDRLRSTGSERSRYWRDAVRVAKARPVFGVGANGYGAARLRIRSDTSDVAHAHGFWVQVLADLGIVGLTLSLALFGAWVVAARRTLGWRGEPWPPERVGAVALFAAVLAFGVQSAIDWTWSIPSATLPALIAAAWLAGRGPISGAQPGAAAVVVPSSAERLADRGRWLPGLGTWLPRAQIVAFAVLALWSITQPYRAFQTSQRALAAIERGDIDRAVELSRKAVEQDSVSLDTHATEATALTAGGDISGARATLERAIALQPQNPAAWVQLLGFELGPAADAERAAGAYKAARYLDPYSQSLRRMIESALARPQATTTVPTVAGTNAAGTSPADLSADLDASTP